MTLSFNFDKVLLSLASIHGVPNHNKLLENDRLKDTLYNADKNSFSFWNLEGKKKKKKKKYWIAQPQH